jgi:Sec-independent protein translocase protein TatA
MGDLGLNELAIIAVMAVLLYGKELPDAARKAGAAYSKARREIRRLADEVRRGR